MKKLYTLLIVMLIGFVGKAQIVAIPNVTFKTRLLSSSPSNTIAYSGVNPIAIDANNDGEIQLAEATVIDSLDVSMATGSGFGIQDMTGITAFSNLKSLKCMENT